jgi:peroxiredoxin
VSVFKGFLPLIFAISAFTTKAQVPSETVPDFNFLRLDKKPFTNKDLVQKMPLFFVFFDADCDHCQHAIQYLDGHYNDFKKAAIYLVTLDGAEKINAFLNKYGPNLAGKKKVTILQDSRNEFIIKFKPRKYPSLFLYSSQKKLVLYDDNEKNMDQFAKKINKT